MSIVTLKRKTQAQYNNMSVNAIGGFSLNGTRRSQGYIGQTSLSRTLVRSLANGSTLRGHGGCCGTYPIENIKTSPDMAILNDATAIKSSSLNTHGRIMSKFKWIRRPQPYTSVKPDNTRNINDQGSYIDHLAKQAVSCDTDKTEFVATCKKCNPSGQSGALNYQIQSNQAVVITKPTYYTGAIDQSEYLRNLDNKCTIHDSFKFSNNKRTTPFGCGGNP
jgi:hypothetical protein